MSNLRYTEEHQWADNDHGVVTVGISEFAQSELGDVVYVELPDEDIDVQAGERIATVESVKTARKSTPRSAVVSLRLIEIWTTRLRRSTKTLSPAHGLSKSR